MLDISWGELLVVGMVGVAVTGRQDLPAVFRFAGTQLGRIVGLLQGARARVDQYAAQNELRQLQNELRSGLRELDQVRMELAVAASSQGMMGRTLGVTTPSANRVLSSASSPSSSSAASTSSLLLAGPATTGVTGNPSIMTTGSTQQYAPPLGINSVLGTGSTVTPVSVPTTTTTTAGVEPPITLEGNTGTMKSSSLGPDIASSPIMTMTPTTISLSASHSEKAALEEEWEKQGIGYQTRAEQLYKLQRRRPTLHDTSGGSSQPLPASGSEILEALIKQNLLWDQYDRVVGEQDLQLQNRMAAMQQQKQQQQQQTLIEEPADDETNTTKKE